MKNVSGIKWLYKVTGKKKISIVFLVIIQMILGISSIVFAFIIRNVIDNATNHCRSGFVKNIIFLVMLVTVQIILRAVVRWLEEKTRSDIENILKSKIFSDLLKKEYREVTAVHSGEWVNRLTSDTVICANGMTEIMPEVIGMTVKMSGALIMIFTIEPEFAYLLFPVGVVLILFTYLFRKVLKKLHRNVQEKDGKLRIFFQERIENMLIIRSFSAENQTENEACSKMNDHQYARMKKNRFSNLCNIGFSGAMNGMYILGLGYCGSGIIKGTISYGTLTAVLQLISQIQSPFANITGCLPKFYSMAASAERLIEIVNFKDDCPDGEIDNTRIHEFYNCEFNGIIFENIDFSYKNPDNVSVFKNVSLKIEKGDFIALTGHSGCGKSTLLKILMCLYPLDSGNIFLLKKNAEKELLTSRWNRFFAYVPQGNGLMSGSIREIVSIGDISRMHDESAIKKALEISCADDFIWELENGIDTVLGERGQGLSEGQMQRLAVARAVLSDNPVLLLDESTSALDEKTERQLLENLHKTTDKTVIIITHRPAALEICDKTIIMNDNGIKEVIK